MADEDIKRWLFATVYKDEPDDEAREEQFNDDRADL